MNKPEFIIVHHSATRQGDAASFRRNHKAKGWRDIGYHYVINNGTYQPDGLIEKGRDENVEGAHCKPDNINFRSIGICLVGNFEEHTPTEAQLTSLLNLCKDIMSRHNIPASRVLGHGEVANTLCPGRYLDMRVLRTKLQLEVSNDYKGHWAEGSIKKAIDAGLLTPNLDGKFRPNDAVTRAELAVILDRMGALD